MATVFISYRRSDSSGWVGRVYDRLVLAFGAESIFYDFDSIAYGEDFPASVEKFLSTCNVVIVAIGPGWLDAKAADGTRRLDRPKDHVRNEIELALSREVTVIPVLFGEAEMPSPEQLPQSIAALSTRNALRISDTAFKSDTERLIRAIQRTTGGAGKELKIAPRSRRTVYVSAAVAVGLVVAGLLSRDWNTATADAPSVISKAIPQTSAGAIDLAEILGEEKGSEVYCKAFTEGSTEMLREMRYGGAVVPNCVVPNNVPMFNFVEAWCHGFSDGVNQAARQLSDEFLSGTEMKRRYDLCVANRRWEVAKE